MSLLDWLFGKKQKKQKEQQEETKQENAIKFSDEKSVESHIADLCEQMLEISEEMEEVRREYTQVSAHLTDIQMVENLEGEQKTLLIDIATNISKLTNTRNEYLNAEQKISDEVFRQMQEYEDEIPKIVRRLMDNEKYLDTIKRDLNRLAGEKVEWSVLRQEREEEQESLKRLSVICLVAFGLSGISVLLLSFVMEWGLLPIIMVAFLATIFASYIVIRTQECAKDIKKSNLNQNHATTLENRIKIKYVNMKNAVDYTYNRFHVKNSRELTYNYEQYNEICREQEKLKIANEDLEYFNNRLLRILKGLNLYDIKIWLNYADAIVEPKEMVEIKHELFTRRQNLREQLDYNIKEIQKMHHEATMYCDTLGTKSMQVREILRKVEVLNQEIL